MVIIWQHTNIELLCCTPETYITLSIILQLKNNLHLNVCMRLKRKNLLVLELGTTFHRIVMFSLLIINSGHLGASLKDGNNDEIKLTEKQVFFPFHSTQQEESNMRKT